MTMIGSGIQLLDHAGGIDGPVSIPDHGGNRITVLPSLLDNPTATEPVQARGIMAALGNYMPHFGRPDAFTPSDPTGNDLIVFYEPTAQTYHTAKISELISSGVPVATAVTGTGENANKPVTSGAVFAALSNRLKNFNLYGRGTPNMGAQVLYYDDSGQHKRATVRTLISRNVANGVAGLDDTGKIPSQLLPDMDFSKIRVFPDIDAMVAGAEVDHFVIVDPPDDAIDAEMYFRTSTGRQSIQDFSHFNFGGGVISVVGNTKKEITTEDIATALEGAGKIFLTRQQQTKLDTIQADRITSGTTFVTVDDANKQIHLGHDNGDVVKIGDTEFVYTGFAGSGTRMVVADAVGKLATQAIPTAPQFRLSNIPPSTAVPAGNVTVPTVTPQGDRLVPLSVIADDIKEQATRDVAPAGRYQNNEGPVQYVRDGKFAASQSFTWDDQNGTLKILHPADDPASFVRNLALVIGREGGTTDDFFAIRTANIAGSKGYAIGTNSKEPIAIIESGKVAMLFTNDGTQDVTTINYKCAVDNMAVGTMATGTADVGLCHMGVSKDLEHPMIYQKSSGDTYIDGARVFLHTKSSTLPPRNTGSAYRDWGTVYSHKKTGELRFGPSSTEKLKTNIYPYQIDISEYWNLIPKYWNWKEGGSEDIGLIAEDLHDIGLTDFVRYEDNDQPTRETVDGIVDDKLYLLNMAAIQELNRRLTSLERMLGR